MIEKTINIHLVPLDFQVIKGSLNNFQIITLDNFLIKPVELNNPSETKSNEMIIAKKENAKNLVKTAKKPVKKAKK